MKRGATVRRPRRPRGSPPPCCNCSACRAASPVPPLPLAEAKAATRRRRSSTKPSSPEPPSAGAPWRPSPEASTGWSPPPGRRSSISPKDPGETRNLLNEASSEQRKASRELARHLEKYPLEATPPIIDAEVAAELRSLGYLSGQSREFGQLDPKDGAAMLSPSSKKPAASKAKATRPQRGKSSPPWSSRARKASHSWRGWPASKQRSANKKKPWQPSTKRWRFPPSSTSCTSSEATCSKPSAEPKKPPRPTGSP